MYFEIEILNKNHNFKLQNKIIKATSAKMYSQHLPNHHKLDMSAKISVQKPF
jgi:hypothetical protein